MYKAESGFSTPSLLRRLGALFYDGLLLLGIFFFATAIVLPFRGGQAFQPNEAGYSAYLAYLFAVMFAFFGWFWTRDGQTLGMRAWKIRLISATGGIISWKQAALRFLPAGLILSLFYSAASLIPMAVKCLTMLTIGLFVLDFCWMFFDGQKRCLHDLVASTRMTSLVDGKGSK